MIGAVVCGPSLSMDFATLNLGIEIQETIVFAEDRALSSFKLSILG